jgi:hypothetical protein
MNVKVLVCARADAPLTIRESRSDQKCSKCNARVMISPDGQACLRREPGLAIICVDCLPPASEIGHVELAAESPEALARSFKGVAPNLWRNRN